MFNSIFSENENDLDGKAFKQKFETTDKAELIDVRTPGEYYSGSIPGAKNIDLMATNFQSQVKNLEKDKTYFLFCRSGNRSGSAASLFETLGLKSFNLMGGIGARSQ